MNEERFQQINALMARYDGLSDGAFFAALEAEGVDVLDLQAHTDEEARRSRVTSLEDTDRGTP